MLRHELQHQDGGRVSPVQILEQDEEWLALGRSPQDAREAVEESKARLVGWERQRLR